MKTLTIGPDTFQLPTKWNELTPDQFMHIATLLSHKIPVIEFKLNCLLLFNNFTLLQRPAVKLDGKEYFYIRIPSGKVHMVTAEDLAFASDFAGFIFKETKPVTEPVPEPIEGRSLRSLSGVEGSGVEGSGVEVNPRLVKNLIPEFRIRDLVFYGPTDGLGNVRYLEYMHAENHLANFYKHSNKYYLDQFIATLYRQQDPGYNPKSIDHAGDRRQKFNDFLVKDHAEYVKHAKPEVKTAILLWYQGCKYYLVHKYPFIFEPPTPVTERSRSDQNRKNTDVFGSHMKIINALTSNDITRNATIRNSLLHEVMFTLNEMRKQQIELEKK